MQKIGSCDFSDLPQPYRDLFESGNLQPAAGHFLPYDPSNVAIPMATFLSVLYIIPAVGIIWAGPYYIYRDPTLVPRIINDMTSGVFQFLVITVIFSVIIWGIYFMLNIGLRSVADAMIWINTKRAAAAGKHHYGLLLDAQNLIVRHGDHFADHMCAFVPKSAIKDCFVSKVRIEGSKRHFYIDVVKVRYVDDQTQVQELVLEERFSMSAPEMHSQIQQWLSIL